MELQISGKNTELSPQSRTYIERKLSKLGHYLTSIMETKVEVSEEKTKSAEQHCVVRVTVTIRGSSNLLVSEERGAELFIAVDKVAAVMHGRIEHFKGKHYDKRRSVKEEPPSTSTE